MPLDPQLASVLDLMALNPMAKMSQGTPEQARTGFRMLTVGLRDPRNLAQVRSVEDAPLGPVSPAAAAAVRELCQDLRALLARA